MGKYAIIYCTHTIKLSTPKKKESTLATIIWKESQTTKAFKAKRGNGKGNKKLTDTTESSFRLHRFAIASA